jgi:histidinol-phosphatase (PHP family)
MAPAKRAPVTFPAETAALPADYHMHTRWCCHATGEMREYVLAAVERGLTEIGFSVHLPVPCPIDEKLNLDDDELPLYVAELERLRTEFAGQITLRMGGEADYIPGRERVVERLAAAFPFDYLYGSVHYVGDWGIDNPDQIDRWETGNVVDAYRRYYAVLADAMRTGLFNVIGHLDLPKKFGHRPAESIADAEAAIVEAAAEFFEGDLDGLFPRLCHSFCYLHSCFLLRSGTRFPGPSMW